MPIFVKRNSIKRESNSQSKVLKITNKSYGENAKAMTPIRNFIMERFIFAFN